MRCVRCYGTGEKYPGGSPYQHSPCPACEGTGEVWVE